MISIPIGFTCFNLLANVLQIIRIIEGENLGFWVTMFLFSCCGHLHCYFSIKSIFREKKELEK